MGPLFILQDVLLQETKIKVKAASNRRGQQLSGASDCVDPNPGPEALGSLVQPRPLQNLQNL